MIITIISLHDGFFGRYGPADSLSFSESPLCWNLSMYGAILDHLGDAFKGRDLIPSGQKEKARAALEAEVLKGLNSGDSTPMTDQDWQ